MCCYKSLDEGNVGNRGGRGKGRKGKGEEKGNRGSQEGKAQRGLPGREKKEIQGKKLRWNKGSVVIRKRYHVPHEQKMLSKNNYVQHVHCTHHKHILSCGKSESPCTRIQHKRRSTNSDKHGVIGGDEGHCTGLFLSI